MNLRGFYGAFEHDRAQDWEFLAAWQPSFVKVMPHGSTDPERISIDRILRLLRLLPDALIAIRIWDMDDRNGEAKDSMHDDPEREAALQHTFWRALLNRFPAPFRHRLVACAINEPDPQRMGLQLRRYTARLLQYGTNDKVRYLAYNFSVGTPSLPGEHQYDWPYFAQIEQLFLDGQHLLGLHEYMQPEGMYAIWTDDQGNERRDYGYLVGRHLKCPMKRVPIVIGEWGVDGILYNRHRHPQHGHSGWRNFGEWSPTRYADELAECARVAGPNVIAICPFITDHADKTWQSFDPQPAYAEMMIRKHLFERTGQPVPPPPAPAPPPMPPAPVPPAGDTWQRALAWVLVREGGWSDHPQDPGGATMKGITLATYTRWRQAHGQPSPTKDDLRNISDAEVAKIYYEWYWLASKSDTLPWPLCLANFDTAVNAGTGRAAEMLQKSGGNFLRYMAYLIDWYTRINNFEIFGRAWIQRRAALLMEASK